MFTLKIPYKFDKIISYEEIADIFIKYTKSLAIFNEPNFLRVVMISTYFSKFAIILFFPKLAAVFPILLAALCACTTGGVSAQHSTGSVAVRMVVMPHCFEVIDPSDVALAVLIASKKLLCAARSGMGKPVQVITDSVQIFKIFQGPSNAVHRSGFE